LACLLQSYLDCAVRRDRELKQRGFRGILVMIERSTERRALLREVINLPALLSFDGISGVHPCVVHDINAFGARLSTPYYTFASGFDLSFNGFRKTFACRVAWRRATLCGVVFVMRRGAPKRARRASEK
jgi:hypothetical protein